MRISKQSLALAAVLAVCGLFLASCGGGGGGQNQQAFGTPNTEWAAKTISVSGQSVTYLYGEGNPSAVALSENQIKSQQIEYLNQATEQKLKVLLENSQLKTVVNLCKLWAVNAGTGLYDAPIAENEYSMEKILYIDGVTNRKAIDVEKIIAVRDMFVGLIAHKNDNPENQGCVADVSEDQLGEVTDLANEIINDYLRYALEK